MRKKHFVGANGEVARRAGGVGTGRVLAALPYWIGSFLCAAALHNVELIGGVTPVALAFLMGVPQSWFLPTAAGFFVGGWLLPSPINAVYLSAAGIVAVVRFLVGSTRRPKPGRTVTAAIVAGTAALAMSKLASLFFMKELTLMSVGAVLAEAAVLVPLARFFQAGYIVIADESPSAPQIFSADVCLMLVAVGFYKVTVGYLSAGRIIIAFLCLALCYSRSQERGMTAAAFLSAAMLISEPMFYFAASGLMVGAAAAAVFSSYSKLAALLPFAAANALFALAAPKPIFAWTFAAEVAVGAALFLIIPIKKRAVAESAEPPKITRAERGLKTAAKSLASAARLIDGCSRIDRSVKSAEGVINSVANEACRSCAMMERCWVKSYDAMTEDMALLMHAAEHGGGVSQSDMSQRLFGSCIRPVQLIKAFNRHYAAGAAGLSGERSLRAYKGQMVEQLAAVSRILMRAAEEVSPPVVEDKDLANDVAADAQRADIPILSLQITRSETGGAAAAVTTAQPLRTKQRIELERILSKRSGMVFSADGGLSSQRRTVFCRRRELSIKLSDFCRSRREVSADIYTSFVNYLGFGYVLLADGMGTGADAAADAASACALARDLLESGCDGREAAAYVNSMLSIRDSDESAISLDVFEINLFTGEAAIYKAGGAPSFIMSAGRVTAVYSPSLPVGIMDELCCRDCRAGLAAGDAAALVSDGVFTALGGQIATLLEENRFDPDGAGKAVMKALGDDVSDDVTLLIISVEEGV